MAAEFVLADITALKTTPVSELADGILRVVKEDAELKPSWYMYHSANTDTPDDYSVVAIDGSPSTGRFLKFTSSSSSGGGGELTYSWTLKTPTYNQIVGLQIFFLAMSESQYTGSTTINLNNNRIGTFIPNTNYVPGELLNISSLVEQNGPGLYFFAYRLQDASYWENVGPFYNPTEVFPKGAIRYLDPKPLYIEEAVDFEDTGHNIQSNAPLVVIQNLATAIFYTEPPITAT